MDLLFAFPVKDRIVIVNLYKVNINVYGDYIAIVEAGCDNPSSWEIWDDRSINMLRAWLINNALGGEIFVERK